MVGNELFRLACVVVHCPYIGLHMTVSAGIIDGSCGVDGLCEVVQIIDEANIHAGSCIPSLIERSPCNQARVIAVAYYDVGPLGKEVAHSLVVVHIQSPAGLLAPGQVAQTVSPVVVALLEDLLVQACSIEAHSLAHGNVLLECLVGRSRPDAVGIVALVEHQTLEVRLVVEVEVAVLDVYLAHAHVAAHLVDDFSLGIPYRVFHVVEVGIFGTPQAGFLHGQHDGTQISGLG